MKDIKFHLLVNAKVRGRYYGILRRLLSRIYLLAERLSLGENSGFSESQIHEKFEDPTKISKSAVSPLG